MTRRELLARTTSQELSELLAYEQAYGIADGYFVAGTLAPMWASKKTAADMIPYFAAVRADAKRARGKMSSEEMRSRIKGISDRQARQGRV
jgi:hypothetical protein